MVKQPYTSRQKSEIFQRILPSITHHIQSTYENLPRHSTTAHSTPPEEFSNNGESERVVHPSAIGQIPPTNRALNPMAKPVLAPIEGKTTTVTI